MRLWDQGRTIGAMRWVSWWIVGLCALLMTFGFLVKAQRAEQEAALGAPLLAQQVPGSQATDAPASAASASAEAPASAAPEAPTSTAPPAAPRNPVKKAEGTDWLSKGFSFLGIFIFIGLAWLMSNNRKKVNWRLVLSGTVLQLAFALFIFYVPFGETIFKWANDAVVKLLEFTNEGSKFVFASFITGNQEIGLINFAFAVLPTIIFFSSFMTVLYHLGVMQFIVKGVAWVMLRLMGTSGAESLSAAANIFVGQTEAPLVVKPFIEKMTHSELMTVMTGGFATVAGGVMALYVGMLSPYFPDIAGHLIAASVMSAPAALVIGKVMYPEEEQPATMGKLDMEVEKPDANVIEAAARGASEGLQLALNVGAMILAFIALVALLNYLLGAPSYWHNSGELETLTAWFNQQGVAIPDGCAQPADAAVVGCIEKMQAVAGAPTVSAWPVLTFERILGYAFAPVAFIMGVPWADCLAIGQLLGTKMVLNELVAYSNMLDMLKNGVELQERSVIIATYALCGFANFGSIAIQIGGLGAIAPSRRSDLARLGFRAMIAGSIAAFMTATIAGILA